MFGFHPHRDTLDALLQLHHHIQEGFNPQATHSDNFSSSQRSKLHWDIDLTYTSLGGIRQDMWHHWWTYSPSRALHTASTTLRIGPSCLNSHLHKLGMTDDNHCSWCPIQPHTPEHLLHCPRHHSHCMAHFHSMSSLHLRRLTITDLLGGSQDPGLAFKVYAKVCLSAMHLPGHLWCAEH